MSAWKTAKGPLCRIGVDAVNVHARIGAHAHEKEYTQMLRVSVELVTRPPVSDSLASAFDYACIPGIIAELARSHIQLIEKFASQVAERCLAHDLVEAVEVRVEKPSALSNGLAWAAVSLERPLACRTENGSGSGGAYVGPYGSSFKSSRIT
ncbi:dihydroneopterin aldolase [Sphingobium sp. B2]|uniref:dihydroneopterin aldolase n=1 Tax=Sphingobium sp. B2 TaxID=2583228 RepID=UPI001643A480|nr:dihydroneopterin aldolase [Sphingobium sp. B2]